MPELKTVRISVTLPRSMVEYIDRATEDQKFTRSEVLSEVVRVAREHQKMLRRDVKKNRKSALDLETGDMLKALFSLTEKDVEWIDDIVDKSGTSRSEVVTGLVIMISNVANWFNKFGMTATRRRRIMNAFGVETPLPNKVEGRKNRSVERFPEESSWQF